MIIKPFYKNFYLKTLHTGLYYDAADLEIHSGEKLWGINEIQEAMLDSSNHGWLITKMDKPVGYMLFRAEDDYRQIELINLVIDPEYRRQRLATILLQKLENWRDVVKETISVVVSDQNKFAHLFFKVNGYTAKVENDHEYRFERNFKFSLEKQECVR